MSSENEFAITIDSCREVEGKTFTQNEGEDIKFEEGQIFKDVQHFRTVMRDYVLKRGYNIVQQKNDKKG